MFIKMYEKYYEIKRNNEVFITSLYVNLLENNTILNQVTYSGVGAFRTHGFKFLDLYKLH